MQDKKLSKKAVKASVAPAPALQIEEDDFFEAVVEEEAPMVMMQKKKKKKDAVEIAAEVMTVSQPSKKMPKAALTTVTGRKRVQEQQTAANY